MKLLTLLLSAVLFSQALSLRPSYAQTQVMTPAQVVRQWHLRTLKNIGQTFGTSFTRPRLEKASANLMEATKQSVAHHGQALMLIMIITGVDLVKQHLQKSQLSGQPLNQEELLRHAGIAAEHILTSGEIWSSLAGASFTSAVMAKPLALTNQFIASKVSREIFKNLLQSGIATFILFIGWEMGGQLYREACEMIENTEDYHRSKNLKNLLVNSLRLTIDREGPEYQANWRVLKTVFSNMIQILVHDHDLRNLWLYNTWRNRIATGDFVALVTAMVGSSVVGTALFPGAGTLAGMMFGVVGGLLVIFIPQDEKDQVTKGIQYLRFQFWKMGDDGGPLFNVKKDILEIMHRVISNNEPWPPMLRYQPVANAGEKMIDVLIERIYRLESRLQSTTGMKAVAGLAGNSEAVALMTLKRQGYLKEYLEVLTQLEGIYQTALKDFEQALQEHPVLKNLTPQKLSQYPELQNVITDRERLLRLESFMTFFVQTIRSEMEGQNQLYLPALNRFFMFGFSEDRLLKIQMQ